MALSVGVLTSQGSESWSAGATPTIAHAVGGGHTALGTAQVRHPVHGAFVLLHVLFLIVWAPWATNTGDDGEKEEGCGGPHQEPDDHSEPLHVLLYHLVLFSAAVLVSV